MASHKNQHFVPRCYLKAFSLGGEGLATNLYNIARRCGIQNAPLKTQCSRSYFYGEDLRLERLLQIPENAYTETLHDIKIPGYTITEQNKFVLRRFCYLQYCRTESASRRAAFLVSELTNVAYDRNVPSEWQITMRETVSLSMCAFGDTMSAIDDLKVCLIRNMTPRPFITSDDPAMLTNRWYQQNPKAKGMSGGAGSAGVLFFLPLTPQILCVLYDGDVYSIPSQGGWVRIDRIADIDALNEHQLLRCMSNVYFANWSDLVDLEDFFERALPRRPAARHETVVAILDREDDWGKRYRVVPIDELVRQGEVLVDVREIDPRPRRWPSVISWRSSPRIYSNGTGTGFVRRSYFQNGPYSGSDYKRIR
jgi:hypothetical protein